MTPAHPRVVQGARGQAPRRGALEELLRARPDLVDVHAAGRSHHRVDRAAVRRARRCATPTSPRSRPGSTSARPPSCSSTTRSSRPLEPGHYRNITGNLAVAYGLIAAAQSASLPILYASYPITPASDILHELSKHKNFGVRTLQAEDEIAAGGRDRRRVRRPPRRHGHERPGRRPQVGGARPRDEPRAPARAHRRAARRSVDRPAHQDRAVRPPARDVRASRRGAAADRRAQSPSHCFDAAFEAVRIALKYRTPVILLTDGYLANGAEPWKLPDVDALPDISVPFADRAQPRRRVLAVPARPRDAGPAVGDPRHARPHAPHRRHREAGRHRQRQLRPRQPRAHDAHPRRQGGAASPTTSRRSKVEGDADADVLVLGWGSTWGPISEAVRRVRRAGGRTSVTRTSCTSTRSRATSARCSPATRRCWSRDEPGPAVAAGAGGVPGRRPVAHQGAGAAVQRHRDREPRSWR